MDEEQPYGLQVDYAIKLFDDLCREVETREVTSVKSVLDKHYRAVLCGGRVYSIEGDIAKESSSTVYRARDINGELYAIKVLQADADLLDRERKRLQHVIELLRGVPYVARVIDLELVREKGRARLCIVMELYDKDLSSIIYGHEKLELVDRVRLLYKVSKILAYAHKIGVIHGDLKPQNILLKTLDGWVYPALSDWGGGCTPGYTAPEVYKSNCAEHTEMGDVWSFGALLYEVITGEGLFKNRRKYVEYVEKGGSIRLSETSVLRRYPKLRDIIEACLSEASRPSMSYVSSELSRLVDEIAETTPKTENQKISFVDKLLKFNAIDKSTVLKKLNETSGYGVKDIELFTRYLKALKYLGEVPAQSPVEICQWLVANIGDTLPELKYIGCLDQLNTEGRRQAFKEEIATLIKSEAEELIKNKAAKLVLLKPVI